MFLFIAVGKLMAAAIVFKMMEFLKKADCLIIQAIFGGSLNGQSV